MKHFFLKTLTLVVLGVGFLQCEDGENGVDGLDGIDGINGENGLDGLDGSDGENGTGLDELAEFGAITLTLEGTRPDAIPFERTESFKFLPIGNVADQNLVTRDGSTLNFVVTRTLSTPDASLQASVLGIELTSLVNSTTAEQEFDFNMAIDQYAIIDEDLSFFNLNDAFFSSDETVSDFTISDFSFDEETHVLSFSFSFTVDGDANSTTHPLSVSGTVNATIFEFITSE